MKYESFNKQNLKTLRAELEKVLKEHGPEGIEFGLGNIKFSEGDCTIQVNAKIEGKQTFSETMLLSTVESMGLKLENDKGWKLVDYKARNHKYPFIMERDGKRYKVDRYTAKAYFGK